MSSCLSNERSDFDPRRRLRRSNASPLSPFALDVVGLVEGTGQWENMQAVVRRWGLFVLKNNVRLEE